MSWTHIRIKNDLKERIEQHQITNDTKQEALWHVVERIMDVYEAREVGRLLKMSSAALRELLPGIVGGKAGETQHQILFAFQGLTQICDTEARQQHDESLFQEVTRRYTLIMNQLKYEAGAIKAEELNAVEFGSEFLNDDKRLK